jgi:hypothetical protein
MSTALHRSPNNFGDLTRYLTYAMPYQCGPHRSAPSPSPFSASYSYLIILLPLLQGWATELGDLLPEAEQLDGGSERVRQGAGGDARRGQGLVPQGRGQLCPQRLGGGQGRGW